jgi:uncharacterized protein with HEPN domain
MSKDKQHLSAYLEHIVEAIQRIERYSENMDKAVFEATDMVQDAIVRNIEIVGEASNNIRKHHPEFVEAHADLPWGNAYGMRNALAHGYYQVDLDVVWNVVKRDLPRLRDDIQALLDGMTDKIIRLRHTLNSKGNI